MHAPRIFGVADIAQDRKQPGLDVRAAIGVEMPECAQVTFLRRVLGIGSIAEQIARELVDVIEVRQRHFAEPPSLLRIA